MSKSALVLGASGRFGRNAAIAFREAGWSVSEFDRATQNLDSAAVGKDVIVNAWNPPYPDWARTVPDLTNRVISAGKLSGATVIIPGNVYVFGPNSPAVLTADTPHLATNPLGRIRIEMEQAYKDSGVQTIVLRGGDFLDTQASGNWFDAVIAAKIKKGRVSYPGRLDIPHAWAFLPDMAQAAVSIAQMRDKLRSFEDVPFPGYTLSGAQLAATIGALTPIKPQAMSWLPIKLAAPVWRTGRHLLEMRYLWDMPHQLDGTYFSSLLPDFQATPIDQAIELSIAPLR